MGPGTDHPTVPPWITIEPEGLTYAPYFYEHLTLEEAERLERAAAERCYKIVCLQPYDHYHKNTYFVKGAFLAEFLQKDTFTAFLRERIVSIEPVEHIPSTGEKLA